ncbi:MAG: Ig-like domain-containing protein [Prevotellaceae bacterium]|jgi:uncharacterized protein YjdB/Leucine-rich repeat (LRR) protein|nr:Ig-like domain-containing protein [Prevotellaceae bacterium]
MKKVTVKMRYARHLFVALCCGLCTLLPKTGSTQTNITAAFTDANFRSKVYDAIGKTAPAPILDTDVAGITGLFVWWAHISNLSGIQHFVNLEELECYGNQLTEMDVSQLKKLKTLSCYGNQLTSLNVSGLTNLQRLDCSENQLMSLSVSGLTKLEDLQCYENQLTSLNVSGLTKLEDLNCSNNLMRSTTDVTGWKENKGWIFNPQTTTDDITAAFTDDNFRNAVYEVIGKTAPEPIMYVDVVRITSLSVANKQIASLSGIQYFTRLQTLRCDNNKLTVLDVSGLSNLKMLECYSNQLTALDVSGLSNLQILRCYSNQLTALDVSGLTNLQSFDCSSNQLTTLNVSGLTNLMFIYCSSNQLTTLNVSGLTNLILLICSSNQLTSLNVAGLTNLTWLDCRSNRLTTLDVSGLTNLTTFICYSNQLTALDVSGLTNLTTLSCYSNQLTTLNVSGLTNLQTFECYYNQLTTLNVSGLTNLQTFDCHNNYMTSTADVVAWIEGKGWIFDPQRIRVSGVTLNKSETNITINKTEQLTATIAPTNATNKTRIWSSSNASVASVSNNGLVTAKSVGTATITVTTQDGGYTKTCAVTVVQPATGVSLNKTATTINVNATEQLTATVAPENATNKAVTWSSSKAAVATVSEAGLVTAVSPGTAKITVTTQDGGRTSSCTVTVVQPATGVSLNKTTTTLNVNATEQLTATVAPANATNKAVSWSSSNTAVATVSSTGLVTAKSAGTATITVTTADGGHTATCTVTVEDLPLTLTALTLDGGVKIALNRNVRLSFTFSGGVPRQFRTAESEAALNSAAWQTYSEAALFHAFATTAHGHKTVYAQLQNGKGATAVRSAKIIYKPAHPKQELRGFAINAGAWSTDNRTVTLNHSVVNGVPTLYSVSENPLLVGKVWLPYKELPLFTLSNGEGLKEVYFAVANAADTSEMVSAQIWLNEPVTESSPETEAASDLQVKLYPNPVETTATVEVTSGKGKVQVSVYDMSGRMYLSRTFDTPTFSLDLTDCPSGILLVRITNNGNSVIRKVIKN